MRKLIILRGPSGSGKSTFVKEMSLDYYNLSMDQIRLLYRAPELNSLGLMQISQEDNQLIYKEYLNLIEKRMSRGEFLILEGLFLNKPNDILEIARKNKYEILCVDFHNIPYELNNKQNFSRDNVRSVSKEILEKTRASTSEDWGLKTLFWDKEGQFKKEVIEFIKIDFKDLSNYKKIHHIGDLQGCLTVLIGDGGLLEKGFNDDEFYIFVGDLLDRGIENDKVLKWVNEEVVPRNNTAIIWGNHEDHIWRWANNMPAVSPEFRDFTQPQLEAAGLKPSDGLIVCNKAIENLFYTYNGKKIMVTHAGLPTVPEVPALISSKQYSKGTGNWSDPIDQQFEKNSPKDWYQIHGHRNHHWQEIQATERSFNLENQVEFGGRLRWVSLDQNGFTVGSNVNKVYKMENDNNLNWKENGVLLSNETAQLMRSHEGVKEKTMPSMGHIVSFNFTKDVFFKKSWDDLVVKARGFFVNKETNEIVSRGYDKFFNINERSETKIDNLMNNLKAPIIGYVKENGYLGNIGFDSKTGELFVASKSTNEGDFADWFRNILDKQMSKTKQEGLARWLRDNEACMTFEVIDPVNDPHMIDYPHSKIVLLDIFHRSEKTEIVDYETLRRVAGKFDLEVKERGMIFKDTQSFVGWYEKVSTDINYRFKGQDIEGFVFEDANGFMTKIKMANYAFWKRMRGQVQRLNKEWEKVVDDGERNNKKIDSNPYLQEKVAKGEMERFDAQLGREKFAEIMFERGAQIHPAAAEFLKWCAMQDSINWKKSIIELRKDFLNTNVDLKIFEAPYSQEPEEQNQILKRKVGGL